MIIVLYVMDSLRAEFLSCYGYEKETSPHIDELARDGVLFRNAFAQSTWTRPSGASLLTSAYPSFHGVMTRDDALSLAVPTLPELFKAQGFETLAVSAMINISPQFGFGKGFDHFVELYREETVRRKRTVIRPNQTPVCTSEDINAFLFPWLDAHAKADLFILIWSVDTHNPYYQRDRALARFYPVSDEIFWAKDIVQMQSANGVERLKALYQEMIYYNDHHLGVLVETLKRKGLYEETLFVLTSDHGESFGEHGINGHGGTPFDEQMRVPLILKFPQSQYRGQNSGLVQHIDLAPTTLQFTKSVDLPASFQGVSLLPLLQRGRRMNDFAFCETQLAPKVPRSFAVRSDRFKYIELRPGRFSLEEWKKEKESLWPESWIACKPRLLFNLEKDPEEKTNLASEEPRRVKRFHSQVQSILQANRKRSRGYRGEVPEKVDLDEEVRKQLQALGYFE